MTEQSTLWVERSVEYIIDLIYALLTYLHYLVEGLPWQFDQFYQSAELFYTDLSETFWNLFSSSFSDFQIKLLQVFISILTIHVLAICIAWKIYSERITQRFLKPSLYQISHEQLKTAVSELKLPAEHTPRW